jgi:hypothetical protein
VPTDGEDRDGEDRDGEDRDGPRDDDTAVVPETPRGGGPSGTAILPATPDQPADDRPRWAGRAAVPPPRVEEDNEGWPEPPATPFLPLIIAVVAVVLLGILALGAFLILNSDRPAPVPTEPVPTSIVVTTRPPSPTPTTVAPTAVVVPRVPSADYDSAAAALTALGLVPQRRDIHDELSPGTVIGTDPPEGSVVAPGSVIDVLVSLGPEPSATPPPTGDTPPTATAPPT